MRKWAMLIVLVGRVASADEDPCCCEKSPSSVDPLFRDELIAATALFAVGHTIALATQFAVPGSTTERIFGTVPVFGSIDAAVRTDSWEARMTLVFATGVQLVGILMAATAAAVHKESRPKNLSFNGNGMQLKF